MSKIFIAAFDSGLAAAVQRLLPKIDIFPINCGQSGDLSANDREVLINEAEVLLADASVLQDVIQPAKKLKFASCTWAGIEGLVKSLKNSKPLSCELTRCGGAFNNVMAEYVLGYILTKERFIIEVAAEQQKSTWNSAAFRKYRTLSDLTIGLLGVGEIGKEVARLCCCCGMKVVGVTRTPPTDDNRSSSVSEYRTLEELPELLKSCDYVCSVLPSTPGTQGLLSGDIFSHCQNKKSIFINVGRGNVTDEESIVKAIRNGWLGGAVLDVFNEEPLPANSPLWTLPGVLITPHIAGVQMTSQVAKSFVENYQLYLDNKPLKYKVDLQQGY